MTRGVFVVIVGDVNIEMILDPNPPSIVQDYAHSILDCSIFLTIDLVKPYYQINFTAENSDMPAFQTLPIEYRVSNRIQSR